MMSSTPDTDLEYSAGATTEGDTGDVADGSGAMVDAPRKARTPRRVPKSDAVLEAAADEARAGLLEVAPEAQIGRHVSATVDGERLVTHRFEAFVPGYGGWQWYSTLARVARSKDVTVCEVGLLPSSSALLAPEWLPWSERVRPEDSQQEDGIPQVPVTAVGEVPVDGADVADAPVPLDDVADAPAPVDDEAPDLHDDDDDTALAGDVPPAGDEAVVAADDDAGRPDAG